MGGGIHKEGVHRGCSLFRRGEVSLGEKKRRNIGGGGGVVSLISRQARNLTRHKHAFERVVMSLLTYQEPVDLSGAYGLIRTCWLVTSLLAYLISQQAISFRSNRARILNLSQPNPRSRPVDFDSPSSDLSKTLTYQEPVDL